MKHLDCCYPRSSHLISSFLDMASTSLLHTVPMCMHACLLACLPACLTTCLPLYLPACLLSCSCRKDEAARILAARGWITEEKELYMARLHRMDFSEPIAREKAEQMTWTTIYRVCGEISVSRSIGDPDYKTFQPGIKKSDGFFIWPDGHDQVCCHSFSFCLPLFSISFLLKFNFSLT